MFEAENNNNQREDYIFNILEQNAFQRIVEKEWHPRQEIKLIGQMIQGKYVVGQIKFPNVASPMELKKWVLGWGSALEVVAPRHFKEEIQNEIKILFDRCGCGVACGVPLSELVRDCADPAENGPSFRSQRQVVDSIPCLQGVENDRFVILGQSSELLS